VVAYDNTAMGAGHPVPIRGRRPGRPAAALPMRPARRSAPLLAGG